MEVAFLDYTRGAPSGFVRFKTADGAKAAYAALEAEERRAGGPKWRLLTDVEAEEYRKESKAARAGKGKGKGGGKGKGKGGGKGTGGGKGRGAPRGWGGIEL